MVNWLLGKSALLRVVRASLSLLSKRDQQKIKLVALIQIFLSFLDLLGIALSGVVASLAVSGINSKNPSGAVGIGRARPWLSILPNADCNIGSLSSTYIHRQNTLIDVFHQKDSILSGKVCG